MEHIVWDSPATLVIGRNLTAYSGTLSNCILHFRDELSITRKVTCRITLARETANGKTWLWPEDIYELMTAEDLPPELQSAF
jgi:hypothetical protein